MKAVAPANHKPPKRTRNGSLPRRVRFEFLDSSARSVRLVGTFNAWRLETGKMNLVEHGKWVKELDLAPGTYEYRYVVDGSWVQDPNAEHSVTNPFGERNSLLCVEKRNGG